MAMFPSSFAELASMASVSVRPELVIKLWRFQKRVRCNEGRHIKSWNGAPMCKQLRRDLSAELNQCIEGYAVYFFVNGLVDVNHVIIYGCADLPMQLSDTRNQTAA